MAELEKALRRALKTKVEDRLEPLEKVHEQVIEAGAAFELNQKTYPGVDGEKPLWDRAQLEQKRLQTVKHPPNKAPWERDEAAAGGGGGARHR